MVRMGAIFRRTYGNIRFGRGNDAKRFEIKKVEYQPSNRQISLDVAIKRHQTEIARQQEAKRQRREKQIETAKRLGGNFLRALQESDNTRRRRKSKRRKR